MKTFVNALVAVLAGAFALAPPCRRCGLAGSDHFESGVGCLALAGAFILGVVRKALWMTAVLALGATVLNLGLLFTIAPGWRLVAIFEPVFIVWASYLLAAFGLICGAGWGLGRCISLLVRSLFNHDSPIRGDAKP